MKKLKYVRSRSTNTATSTHCQDELGGGVASLEGIDLDVSPDGQNWFHMIGDLPCLYPDSVPATLRVNRSDANE